MTNRMGLATAFKVTVVVWLALMRRSKHGLEQWQSMRLKLNDVESYLPCSGAYNLNILGTSRFASTLIAWLRAWRPVESGILHPALLHHR